MKRGTRRYGNREWFLNDFTNVQEHVVYTGLI